MIIYDILLILQYKVSTTVMDLIVVFALFVFMLALLCFFVATAFSVNKDLCIKLSCLYRVRFGGVNSIPDNSRLPIHNFWVF